MRSGKFTWLTNTILVTLAVVGIGKPGHAQDFDSDRWLVYEVGPAVILPNIGVSSFYDSDVLLGTTPNEQSDFIISTRPEMKIQFGAEDINYLNIQYAPNYLKYFDTDFLTRVDHQFGLNLKIERPKTTITGSSAGSKLGGFIGQFQNFATVPTDRITHNHNYRILQNISGKTSGSLAFSYGVQDFEQGSPIIDTTDWRVTGGGVFNYTEKMDLLAEVFYGQSTPGSNRPGVNAGPSASRVGFFVGSEAEFTPKLNGSVRVGYQDFSVDNSSVSQSSIVVRSDLTYAINAMSQLSLNLNRGAQQNIQAATAITQFTDVGVTYAQMLDTSGRWGMNSSVRYRFSSFEGAPFTGREDNFFTISGGVNYLANDWFRAGLTYSYTDFSSSVVGLPSYGVHRVGLEFVIGY